ncbi:hypothetical protein BD626DRAFT_535256 [Schizophyllum amplum]|uniref:Nuclear pore complex component-domain-containing protein n=1 Tax=Schizophyllum amplum TaxID=97359 RepID=A0A550CLS6_9AGAR|nr:hypothetical protein BD626DRAFT_535256 [Auriculariopsis ampla]
MSQQLQASPLKRVATSLKPHRSEAIVRVRANALALSALLILTWLLPVPSLTLATRRLSTHWYEGGGLLQTKEPELLLGAFELLAATIFAVNLLQGFYAIKFPRKTPTPPPESARRQMPFKSPQPSAKRPFKNLTPKSTPQPQRAFSASTNNTPLGASSSIASLSATSPSKYPASPVSTPSRVLQYSIPDSLSSTASTLPPTPSPIMSEYRNKQRSVYGRPIDASFLLSQVAPDDD